MKKVFKWAAALLIAAVFVGTFVFLYQKSRPKKEVYEICVAELSDLEKKTIVTGKIEPRDEVNIKPQISGIISELYKEAGQNVKKDEVIAKVKVIPDMGNLSSSENRVRLSEISLAQAQKDYDRMKKLYEEKVVSAEEFEKTEVVLRNAQAENAASKDALNIVREGISLSNATMSTTLIRSTVDGLILDIPVKVGNSVILSNSFNDGTTIATVANMSDLIFRGNIDETEVGQLSMGIPLKITIGALQDMSFDAALEYISPKATETNGANQFEIKAAIKIATTPNGSPSGKSKIRSGYSANAEIVLAKVDRALTIPESAIEFSGDSTFVYVLTDSVGEKKYDRRHIETGLSDCVNIEVKKGLTDKDKVRGPEIISDDNKED